MAVDTAIMNELYTKLGVSSTEAEPTAMSEETVEEVVSTPEDPSMAAQAYEQYEELPLMQQLALAVAPGTGHAIAGYETPMFAGETKEAIEEGNIPRALGQGAMTGLSALGMIPGLGLGIRGVKAGVKAATKGLRKFDFEYDVSGPAYMYAGEGRKIVDQDPGRLTIEARNLDEAKKLFNIEKRATNEYKRMDKEWAGRWFTPQGNPASPRVTIGRIQEGDATHYLSKSRKTRAKKYDTIKRDELDTNLRENLQQYEEGLLFPQEFEIKRANLLKQLKEVRKLTKNEEAILEKFSTKKIKFNPDDIDIAKATSRSRGAIGKEAVTPRYVSETAKAEDTILNYGAGADDVHTPLLREKGLNVEAHDFHNPNPEALGRKYDTVFGSNVINVQATDNMLKNTLDEMTETVASDGRLIVNLPISPRKGAWTGKNTDIKKLRGLLEKRFESVNRVGGTSSAPVFEAWFPKNIKSKGGSIVERNPNTYNMRAI